MSTPLQGVLAMEHVVLLPPVAAIFLAMAPSESSQVGCFCLATLFHSPSESNEEDQVPTGLQSDLWDTMASTKVAAGAFSYSVIK
jgi:hypothetical protein